MKNTKSVSYTHLSNWSCSGKSIRICTAGLYWFRHERRYVCLLYTSECIITEGALEAIIQRYSNTSGIRDLEQAAERCV